MRSFQVAREEGGEWKVMATQEDVDWGSDRDCADRRDGQRCCEQSGCIVVMCK